MNEIAEELTITVRGSELDERERNRLESVLQFHDVEGSEPVTEGTLNLDRLIRVVTVYHSIGTFRYDWRWLGPQREIDREQPVRESTHCEE